MAKRTKTQKTYAMTANGTPLKSSNHRSDRVLGGPAYGLQSVKRGKQKSKKKPKGAPPGTIYHNGRYVPMPSDDGPTTADDSQPTTPPPRSPSPEGEPMAVDDDEDSHSYAYEADDHYAGSGSPLPHSKSTTTVGLESFRDFWKQTQPLPRRKRRHATYPQWRTSVIPKVLPHFLQAETTLAAGQQLPELPTSPHADLDLACPNPACQGAILLEHKVLCVDRTSTYSF